MTREEVIRMAREACLGEVIGNALFYASDDALERFAALVAAHERAACAKVVEMIFPPRPKGIERDDTEHGRLYYTADDLRRYGLQCVEEYKRCQRKVKKSPEENHLAASKSSLSLLPLLEPNQY